MTITIAAMKDSIDAIKLTTYEPSLIVGCVDNAQARASIKELMIQHVSMFAHGITKKPCWWIDCGNSYTHGQVADQVVRSATGILLSLMTMF